MVSLNILTAAALAVFAVAIAAGVLLYYNIQPNPTLNDKQREDTGINTAQEREVPRDNNSTIVISSPYVKEYHLPKDSWPNGILVDSKGTIWTLGSKSHSLISFNPKSEEIREYPIPASEGDFGGVSLVWAMVEGNDGSIWFSGSRGIPMWRFDPSTETFEAIRSLNVSPIQMKKSEDGRIWFTSPNGVIGSIQQDNGSAKEFELGEESFPSGIFLQNQSLWITQSMEGKITIFNISKQDGRIVNLSEIAKVPQNSTLLTPTDIIVANGSAWVTEHGTSFLTKYDIKTGEMTRYPTAVHPVQIVTLPYWLESDAKDGKGLWFNEHRGNRIAFFDFQNETLTEYEIPTRVPSHGYISNALTIAGDKEDQMWFTELTEDKIGVVDRNVSLPFDINLLTKQVNLEKGKNEVNIELEISRNDNVNIFNNTLSFNVSSTIIPSGLLANATASFSPNSIDLSEIGNDGVAHVILTLNNNGLKAGNYVLAVSASDGSVIRSVYLDLIVN